MTGPFPPWGQLPDESQRLAPWAAPAAPALAPDRAPGAHPPGTVTASPAWAREAFCFPDVVSFRLRLICAFHGETPSSVLARLIAAERDAIGLSRVLARHYAELAGGDHANSQDGDLRSLPDSPRSARIQVRSRMNRALPEREIARPSSDKERGSLKAAFARAVEALGGGTIVAGFTRVRESMLSRYAVKHDDDRFAGIDVAFDIDKAHAIAGGEPPILATYATLLGFGLARLEAVVTNAPLTLADAARLDREIFEARAALYEVLTDGRLTPTEKRRALKDLAELKAAIAAIEAKVEAA